jgi:hypothetical protein
MAWLVGAVVAPGLAAGAAAAASGMDSGGGRGTGGVYVVQSCVGGIAGVATSAAPVRTLKAGYIGQLTEVVGLDVQAAPAAVDETTSSQLSGTALLDDVTVVALAGSNVLWASPAYPVGSINSRGSARAAHVYADTLGVVTGRYLGVAGTGTLWVVNVDPDDFGIYAGDTVPDDWQVRYFGTDNPLGYGTNNPDLDPHNNLQEYTADTNPTNGLSFFRLTAITNRVTTNIVYFLSSTGRVYTLQYATNLLGGSWANAPGQINVWGSGGLRGLTNAGTTAQRFFRVDVRAP